jgi:uncharacterized protein YdcH (DUF465 family)
VSPGKALPDTPHASRLKEKETMFPEYRDLITQLKNTDHHFTRLFDKHNHLDEKIKHMVAATGPSADLEIEALKKQKLQLKDELYALLKSKATGN